MVWIIALALLVTSPSSRAFGNESSNVRVTLAPGDTLVNVLTAHGLSAQDAHGWARGVGTVMDLRRLRPRHDLTLHFDPATQGLRSLRYEIDHRELLVAEKRGGSIEARREARPHVIQVRGVAGHVERGLWPDLMRAGASAAVASTLAEIFGWDFDLQRLDRGDSFRVLYESIRPVGAEDGTTGRILGATLESRGRTVTAVLFGDEAGGAEYFDVRGQAFGRMFLRYPVAFTRISSVFSHRRFHPTLHRWRAHTGVDFAAPRGTPVRAAASGRVTDARWIGGYGRCVRVAHPDGFRTTYGHLNEISPTVRRGRMVERGQVIGYVGSTGRATGNHLHYEIARHGKHLDPLAFDAARTDRIPRKARRAFKRVRARVVTQLAELDLASTQVVMAQPSQMPSDKSDPIDGARWPVRVLGVAAAVPAMSRL